MLYNEKKSITAPTVMLPGLILSRIRLHYIAYANKNQFIHEK